MTIIILHFQNNKKTVIWAMLKFLSMTFQMLDYKALNQVPKHFDSFMNPVICFTDLQGFMFSDVDE